MTSMPVLLKTSDNLRLHHLCDVLHNQVFQKMCKMTSVFCEQKDLCPERVCVCACVCVCVYVCLPILIPTFTSYTFLWMKVLTA